MKKNIALLISIIALIFLIFTLRVTINKDNNNPKLNGNVISDGIYSYDLETENLSVNGLTSKNNEIYYLLMDGIDEYNGIYNYKLKKINVYKNEVIELQSLENINSYCSLEDETIYCLNNQEFTVYDLNFNKLFYYKSESDNSTVNYIPYKDIYIKLENKEISLIRNNEAELYRNIDTDINLYYENYFITDDNTYINLVDDDGNYYLYNMNEETLTNLKEKNYFKYENGFVFYDDTNFQIYDLQNNEQKEYKNYFQNDYYYTGTLNNKNTLLCLYDIIENKLLIENIDTSTLQEIDSTLFSNDNPIANLNFEDNYLYVYVLQDKNNFYVVNMDELNIPSINTQEYTDEMLSNISKTINNLKATYNINIKIKENAVIEFPDFSAEVLLNNEQILESLTKIETILAKYDKSFFDSFYNNGFNGLNLYLTGSLTPSDYEIQAANPAAYSLIYKGEYMMVIDLNQPNIEELLCHELLHNLEFNLNNQGIYPFKKWSSYNPSDFYYDNSYTSNSKFNYTLMEKDINNVYFIDYYSHTYETEDRARVFENICSCNEDSKINDYPNLYAKGLYLKEEITKYYPNLNHTGLFNSLN